MPTKKEICTNNKSIAYWSGCNGLEIKHIEYGIDDYVYFVAGAWNGKPTYHKAKIHYGEKCSYFKFHGYTVRLDECIRMGG